MGKIIIDLIRELVEISGNATVDTILFAIIGVISFAIAFGLVGALFDALGFYDSDIMSDAHWLIRVAVFAGLTYVGVKVAQFIRWFFSFQWWVYVITGIVFVGIVVLVYYIKHRISKIKAQQTIHIEEANPNMGFRYSVIVFSTSCLFTCLHLIESFHSYRHTNLKRLELFEKLFEIEKRDNWKDIHIHSFKAELTFRAFFLENKL